MRCALANFAVGDHAVVIDAHDVVENVLNVLIGITELFKPWPMMGSQAS